MIYDENRLDKKYDIFFVQPILLWKRVAKIIPKTGKKQERKKNENYVNYIHKQKRWR